MRTRPVLAGALGASLVASVVGMVAAPAAQAYNRDLYTYAAGHMITQSDIPKALGVFDSRLNFSASPGYKNFLCYVPSEDPQDNGASISTGKSQYQFMANYNSKKASGPSVQVQVLKYASDSAAIKAFNAMKTQSKKCNGSGSTTSTDDDGTSYTNSWLVKTSVVPAVSVVGVESIGITQNNLGTDSTSDDPFLNDNYAVYSLVNDAIIETTYFVNGPKNMTSAQRKAVNQVAFNAISEWLD